MWLCVHPQTQLTTHTQCVFPQDSCCFMTGDACICEKTIKCDPSQQTEGADWSSTCHCTNWALEKTWNLGGFPAYSFHDRKPIILRMKSAMEGGPGLSVKSPFLRSQNQTDFCLRFGATESWSSNLTGMVGAGSFLGAWLSGSTRAVADQLRICTHLISSNRWKKWRWLKQWPKPSTQAEKHQKRFQFCKTARAGVQLCEQGSEEWPPRTRKLLMILRPRLCPLWR